jgi:hypothetical protein
MLEKIPLPLEFECLTRPVLPITKTVCNHRFLREAQNQMHMIRHHGRRIDPPFPLFDPVHDRIQKTTSRFRPKKGFVAAILHTASDEINRPGHVDPKWSLMWQGAASGFHPVTISEFRLSLKEKRRACCRKSSAGRA